MKDYFLDRSTEKLLIMAESLNIKQGTGKILTEQGQSI